MAVCLAVAVELSDDRAEPRISKSPRSPIENSHLGTFDINLNEGGRRFGENGVERRYLDLLARSCIASGIVWEHVIDLYRDWM